MPVSFPEALPRSFQCLSWLLSSPPSNHSLWRTIFMKSSATWFRFSAVPNTWLGLRTSMEGSTVMLNPQYSIRLWTELSGAWWIRRKITPTACRHTMKGFFWLRGRLWVCVSGQILTRIRTRLFLLWSLWFWGIRCIIPQILSDMASAWLPGTVLDTMDP